MERIGWVGRLRNEEERWSATIIVKMKQTCLGHILRGTGFLITILEGTVKEDREREQKNICDELLTK